MTQTRCARRIGRGAIAVLAVLTLAAGCGDDDADDGTDKSSDHVETPASVTSASQWLSGQLTDGLIHNDQYDIDDYGLSADVALALDAVDQEPETVSAVSDALSSHVADYTRPGYGTEISAGATAKLALLAAAADQDPTSYGGTDLVAQLEKTVIDDGPSAGRIQDVLERKNADAADYANVVGQALAVGALEEADSPEADAAVAFLLQQQCSDGFFRLSFTADPNAADQSCDGDKASVADVDATAYALVALEEVDDDAVQPQMDAAVGWLKVTQADDGSFSSAGPTAGPNANSTGLAGRALGELHQGGAAAAAATWVTRLQVGPDSTCGKLADAAGAIAYDDAALQAGTAKGITIKSADQFRRATAGALPGLVWAPANTGSEASGPC